MSRTCGRLSPEARQFPDRFFAKGFPGSERGIRSRAGYVIETDTRRRTICTIDDHNNITDETVIPPGSFARDWTEMSALRPQEGHMRVGRSSEVHHA